MPRRTKTHEQLQSSVPLNPSTLEDIDFAMYKHINDTLNIHCDTNKGFKKVPVIFATADRVFHSKNDKDSHDAHSNIIYPVISIERTNITKDVSKRGILAPGINVPAVRDAMGGSITVARKVQQIKSRDRANADAIRKSATKTDKNRQTFPRENTKVVYEVMSIPIPVYLDIEYQVKIKTEYIQQMNEATVPFMTTTGAQHTFFIEHEGNRYESFIQPDFSQENNATNLGTEDERTFETTVTIKVLGHIIGADKNQEQPTVVVRETAAEIKLSRERVMTQDEVQFHLNQNNKFRP